MAINTLKHIPFLSIVGILILFIALGNITTSAQKRLKTLSKREPTSQKSAYKGQYHFITHSTLTPIETKMRDADFCQIDKDYMLVPNCATELNDDGTTPTEEYSIQSVKNILKLDVIEYYDLQSKYDSPLKLKRFKESEEYKEKSADLEAEKNCILDHTYYAIFDLSSQYDLTNKSFSVPLIPCFFDNAYIANGVFITTKDQHFRDGNFIASINDEDLAYQIETNDTQLVIFVKFTGDVDNHGELMCEPSKVYITNKKTGAVYFEYTPQNSIDEKSLSNDNNAEEEQILTIAETMPEFPGGDAALFNFIARNLRYPVVAQENNVQGRVVISFVVDKSGKAINPKIEKSVSPECDKEAKRIINIMPRWKPGTANGQPVNVRYRTSITFRLQ